jgi:hypothetical protein
MNIHSLDPVAVALFWASVFLDPKVAAIVGPYAVIILAAVGGTSYALGDNETITGRVAAFWFLLRGVLWACLITVPISTFVATRYEDWQAQWFFVPAAAGIGYASDKGKKILGFFGDMLRTLIKNWVNRGEQK